MKKENLARMIDHTILKQDTQLEQVKKVCREALEYNFASVCINSSYVKLVADELKGSDVKVCTVIGFPLGATTTKVKEVETIEAIENGAQEVDMVINIGKIKDEDYDYVLKDIKAVVEAASGKALTKVIIETCLLTDKEKKKACEIAKEAGADFVKTSTGFSVGGATPEDIKLMRQTVGNEMGVKASGGVRKLEDALVMIKNGATRIGASSSVQIVNGIEVEEDVY